MLDSKHIFAKVHELQVLANKLRGVKINIYEAFQVSAIIVKFPYFWKS